MPATWARAACAALLAVIGAVFVLKYGARLSPTLASPAAAAFAAAYLVVLAAAPRLAAGATDRQAANLSRGTASLLLLGALATAILGPDTSRVAREPAVVAWLDTFLAGDFPYCLGIRPSGLPGLYLLLAPFHLLGLGAVVPLAGVALFVWLVGRFVPDPRDRVLPLAACLLLPTVHYEGLVRSELFLNSTLGLLAIAAGEWALGRQGRRGTWPAGAVAGVAASTRLVVPLALLVYLANAARRSPRRAAGAAAVAAAVFVVLVLPFIAWDAQRFISCGPLAVQGLYLPPAVPLVALPAALALGWSAADLASVVRRIGGLVLGLVAVAFVLQAAAVGAVQALWGDAFDVSYFALATPFLALSLAREVRLR